MYRTSLMGLLLMAASAGRAYAHDPGMSSLAVLRTNAGLFGRAIVSNRDLPESRRAQQGACDGHGAFKLWVDGRTRELTVRCYAYDPAHTAFDTAASTPSPASLALEWALLDELPRGHTSVARQVDDDNHVRAHALLARGATKLDVLAPVKPIWRASSATTERWWLGLSCGLLALASLLWRRWSAGG